MHLQTLTVKGFKSFASATTLRFEPGITAVVGPNGSGKSNVVDAIAWVLGEQGAKTLRGGKMEDVIFAGTAGRPPLGRAEVTLTIDNHDGALPVEYSEVSITRRMFRDGASEYELNGQSVRLLDIQELLSDSGIGREMHVIVGQGQLDSVLQARPEDRRGFIEEAAGVLKHRKRKEKALRKLDAMGANLTRVTDLSAELRRQLGPLGRQAETARRAAGVQADVRDARLRLLADDLVQRTRELDREAAGEQAIRRRRAEADQQLEAAGETIAGLEARLGTTAEQLAHAQEVWIALTNLTERVRSTASLAAERARNLATPADQPADGPDPDELERQANQLATVSQQLDARLAESRIVLADAIAQRQRCDTCLSATETQLRSAARAIADRREGLARLTGQVNALRARSRAAEDEISRLTIAADTARARAAGIIAEQERTQREAGDLDRGEVGLDERHQSAEASFERVDQQVRELTDQLRTAERDSSAWSARRDALALGLTRKDGAGTLLTAAGDQLVGSLAALLTVEPGWEAAVAAALGPVADSVVVDSAAAACQALQLLREQDAGRAGVLVAAAAPTPSSEPPPDPPPAGTRWALDVVTAVTVIQPAVRAALDRVVLVADLSCAAAVIADRPHLRAVTRGGDLLERFYAHGGSASEPSVLEIQAAADEATLNADQAASRSERLREQLAAAQQERSARQTEVATALAALHESDAALAGVAATLAELGERARSAQAEADRLEEAARAAAQARDRDVAGLAEMEQRLAAAMALAQDRPMDAEPDPAERDAAAAAAEQARAVELEAQLALRTAEERARAGQGRAEGLRRQATAERAARAGRAAARRAREQAAAVAELVHDAATELVELTGGARDRALLARDRIAAGRAEGEAQLADARRTARAAQQALAGLTDQMHAGEVARAEQRLLLQQVERIAAEEFGIDPVRLVAEYGPEQLVPPTAAELADHAAAVAKGAAAEPPQPEPFDRERQARRLARAEKELAKLGKVNPLALEEYAALEERHRFLAAQLEDLKGTRRDLLTVVREVDDRILEVFASAFHDVAAEFETVFATLFPGGQGQLVLTDPDDLLMTGIDVQARPPGKKVKRLSLLSGGERSLTAVALLVAIFRARPSPFYIMDEVEAALDDVNLGRLLTLIEALRSSSQLILITHQKRSMEIADALYGVTMRDDGVSQVISQRLRDTVRGPDLGDDVAARAPARV